MLTLHLQYLFFCKAGKQIVPFACLGCEGNRMISIVYSGKKISAGSPRDKPGAEVIPGDIAKTVSSEGEYANPR